MRMRCSKCAAENRERRKFCAQCGTALSVRCPSCHSENEPAEKFCGECGAALNAGNASAAETPRARAPDAAGERRHLTILFCDLVDSVTLTAQLDPEEWRATVAGYQRAAAEAITRFGGEVVRYVGDGIMAFFGYPAAHENDAERAARAGLTILDTIAQLNEQPAHVKLAVRIGIDSGRVVVGVGTGQAVDAFGDTANIAARVQATAAPDSVVVTGETHRLISGLFVVEERGAQELKGIARPVQLYRVVRPSGMRGRFEAAAAAGGLTPFVGREEELRLLLSRWKRICEGEGQVVSIVGEAGIGKSRLLRRFREELAATSYTWLECATAPFFQNTPFYALGRSSFHWETSQSAEQRLTALEGSLAAAGLDPQVAAPLIAPLLELPINDRYPPLSMTPDQQRKRLLATLVGWAFGFAKAHPLVIAIEDLHWVDPSTLELIQLLAEQGATARLLLLYTARPEFRPSWPPRAHHTQITLNRLGAGDVRTMVGEVAAQKALSDATIATVVERTGGVPLFVEELTRAVLESGGDSASRQIPATLHDSLMARLDRLGAAKEVIQVGAVIGSDFSYELLHAVHPMAEADLQGALRSLTDAELLYVRGIAPDSIYQFKHALIRDAAYEALLKSRRKELHRLVAQTIDERFAELREEHPEVLGRHWAEASENDKAVKYFQLAGARAVERSATVEAARHYLHALELLSALPENVERHRRELELQLAIGPALTAVKGFAAAETERAYTRARELCTRLGDSLELSPALFGLWVMYLVRGELHRAHQVAEGLLRLAQSAHDPELLLYAQIALGHTFLWTGDFIPAREHLESAIAIYDPEHHQTLALRYLGFDAAVYCLSGMALTLWQLGYPDHALRSGNEALALARRLSDPQSLVLAERFIGEVHLFRREASSAQESAESLIALAAERGFSEWLPRATTLRGGAIALQGRYEEGIAQIQEGLAALRATRFELWRPSFLCLLAEAFVETGRLDDGFNALTEAQAVANKNEEREHEAEIHRLKGELLLRRDQSTTEEAQGCFQRAIEVARNQSAKSLELRAATSLARLLESQGRREEARTMLAEIYNWFTEGFDTLDLKEAKALLEALGS
ncbi:MAG TPA: adenylate/guanylate cyclase domain-containing protein [Candidatus Binataceae bacterium]|nr:adenylate/guanylate cyclase domain-containing protein [Candidatus Binataceae bacterium]